MSVGDWLVVLVPIASGLAWMAYNHPEAYFKFALLLVALIFAYMIGVGIWMQAIEDTLLSAGPHINDHDSAKQAVHAALMPSRAVGLFLPLGSAFYVMFLATFQIWLNKDEVKK